MWLEMSFCILESYVSASQVHFLLSWCWIHTNIDQLTTRFPPHCFLFWYVLQFQTRHLNIEIVAQYLSLVLFLCYKNQWFKMPLFCVFLYVCRSAGLSATLLRLSSSPWWRCQLTLSFFHSARIRRSTRGQRNMLLLFWWRHWVIKMRCRDLLNETS